MRKSNAKTTTEKVISALEYQASVLCDETRVLSPFTIDPVQHILLPGVGRERLRYLLEFCVSASHNRGTTPLVVFAAYGDGLGVRKPDIDVTSSKERLYRIAMDLPLPFEGQLLRVRRLLLRLIEDNSVGRTFKVWLPDSFSRRICDLGIHTDALPNELADAIGMYVVHRAAIKLNILLAYRLVELAYVRRRNTPLLMNVFPTLRGPLTAATKESKEKAINLSRAVDDPKLRALVPTLNAVFALRALVTGTDSGSSLPVINLGYEVVSRRVAGEWLEHSA